MTQVRIAQLSHYLQDAQEALSSNQKALAQMERDGGTAQQCEWMRQQVQFGRRRVASLKARLAHAQSDAYCS